MTKAIFPAAAGSISEGDEVWPHTMPSPHTAEGSSIIEFGTSVNEPLAAILKLITLACWPGGLGLPGGSFLLSTTTVSKAANATLTGLMPVLNGEPGTGVKVRPSALTSKTDISLEP